MTLLLIAAFVLAVCILRAVVFELSRRSRHRIAPFKCVSDSELCGHIEVYGRTPQEAEQRCYAVARRRLEERLAKGLSE